MFFVIRADRYDYPVYLEKINRMQRIDIQSGFFIVRKKQGKYFALWSYL
jgi:hypothetical protein